MRIKTGDKDALYRVVRELETRENFVVTRIAQEDALGEEHNLWTDY